MPTFCCLNDEMLPKLMYRAQQRVRFICDAKKPNKQRIVSLWVLMMQKCAVQNSSPILNLQQSTSGNTHLLNKGYDKRSHFQLRFESVGGERPNNLVSTYLYYLYNVAKCEKDLR